MVINIKKIALLVTIILIGVAGIIIFRIPDEKVPENNVNPEVKQNLVNMEINKPALKPSGATINFFAEYRIERERNRGQQIELLREIVNNQSNQLKAREAASQRLVRISEDLEKEMKSENLVKSKGFRECVVITQPHNTTIIVQADNLEPAEEKDIAQLVSDTVGCNEEKVCIIKRKF